MRAQRNHESSCLGRLLRRWRPDRNPLRRGSDRAETAILLLLLFAFVGGAPIAAHAAGTWTYATSAREAQAQEANLHQVRATLLQSAESWNYYQVGGEANARWKAPDGQVRTGPVFVPSGGAADSTVMIWVNRSGQIADSPLQPSQVADRADIACTLAIVGLAITMIIIGLASHWVLDRRRLAAWDADWLASGPSWPSRR
jgi:hypothetical protein